MVKANDEPLFDISGSVVVEVKSVKPKEPEKPAELISVITLYENDTLEFSGMVPISHVPVE